MNIEDKNGYLPDDIPMLCQETDDCKEVIVVHRKQRNQQLSEMVTEVITIRTHLAYIGGVGAVAWWLTPQTPDPEVGGSSPTRVAVLCP